jgi:hypothetical protein
MKPFGPRRAFGAPLACGLLLLFPSPALSQDVAVAATHARKEPLELFEHLRVTLAVEGPAPLRVELPDPLLARESQENWSARPAGRAEVSPAGAGREKWVQDFVFDPYVPGEWSVRFANPKVNGREVEGPAFAVVVKPAEVKEPQGVTGIEKLPPRPPPVPSSAWWWIAGVAEVLVVAVVAWRLRPRPVPVAPAAWAGAAFERLEREGVSGAALVERVAAVVREFVERRFGIPAPKFTTAELLAAAGEQSVWSVEETDALRGILDRCDRAKFAGDVPDDDGCRGLLAAGRDWVDRVSAAGAGPG